MEYTMYVDGSAEPNPGQMGIGVVVVQEDGTPLFTVSRALGFGSNNEAEYLALLAGLTLAMVKGVPIREVRSDSQLLVNQVNGDWSVKARNLKPLKDRAQALLADLGAPTLRWIPRNKNIADAPSKGKGAA